MSGFIYDDGGIEDGQMISFLLFFFQYFFRQELGMDKAHYQTLESAKKNTRNKIILYTFATQSEERIFFPFLGHFSLFALIPILLFYIFCLHYYKEQDSSVVAWQMILEQSREVISMLNPNIHAFQDS